MEQRASQGALSAGLLRSQLQANVFGPKDLKLLSFCRLQPSRLRAGRNLRLGAMHIPQVMQTTTRHLCLAVGDAHGDIRPDADSPVKLAPRPVICKVKGENGKFQIMAEWIVTDILRIESSGHEAEFSVVTERVSMTCSPETVEAGMRFLCSVLEQYRAACGGYLPTPGIDAAELQA